MTIDTSHPETSPPVAAARLEELADGAVAYPTTNEGNRLAPIRLRAPSEKSRLKRLTPLEIFHPLFKSPPPLNPPSVDWFNPPSLRSVDFSLTGVRASRLPPTEFTGGQTFEPRFFVILACMRVRKFLQSFIKVSAKKNGIKKE